MGRRAKKAPVQTKKRVVLSKRFKCPFCANEDVVECKMNHKSASGSLSCRMCRASFQMPIHHLHEPIDVFSEWLDACEAAERGGGVDQDNNEDGGAEEPANDRDYDDEHSDDNLGEASGLKKRRKLNDSPREDKHSQSSRNEIEETAQQQSYASIGLGDSDDDSD